MKKLFLTVLIAWPAFASAAAVKLVLNWKPEAEFGGFYAAQLNGAFKKEGLEVEILPGGVGTPAVQMVAAGQAEFGIAAADEVVVSRDRGSDVMALYAVYQTNPQALMVRADRSVTKLEQLMQSGILAVQRGLPYFLFLEKKFGKAKAKVVPYLGGVAQLAENPLVAQQCFLTSEPIIAKQKNLAVKTFLIADAGFNPYATVVVVKREYWEKNQTTAQAFRRAIDAGWKDYLKSPKAANEVMHKLNPSMDLATLEASAQIQKPLIETEATRKFGLGSMQDSRWNELSIVLKALNQVRTIKPPDQYYLK